MTQPDLFKALIKRDGNKCYYCGEKRYPLEIHHILSYSKGGTTELENCVLVCSICHNRIGIRMNEFEFNLLLTEILRLNEDFTDVLREVRIDSSGFIADITAKERVGEDVQQILIEVTSFTSYTASRFIRLFGQLITYKKEYPDHRIILAIPGELGEKQLQSFITNGIEIWDQHYLSKRFEKEIISLKNPQLDFLLQTKISKTLSLERQYIEQLKKIKPGWADWSKYQKLIGNIVELLFCPPLSKPQIELYDKTRTNRRDFILPNYAPTGQWAFLRDKYSADHIVIDTKNYKGMISKTAIIQLSNYLKKPGAGLFGIIISRTQGNKGSIQTILEKWMLDNKMIIILTDLDVERMLIEKTNGRDPTSVIIQKIEDFRLAI